MKFLLLLLCASLQAEPLTIEQFKVKTELDALSAEGKISYEYDASQTGEHFLGYIPPPPSDPMEPIHAPADVELKEIDLRKLPGVAFPKILNQGSCGSCVVFSVTHNAQVSLSVRKIHVPYLSTQHLMNCGGQAGQCNGDWGANVCKRLVTLGDLTSELLYPYTARTSSCRVTDAMTRYGRFLSYKTISGSFKSILAALNEHKAVSVGIAADGRFSSYRSGVYDGFGSMGTNHYVLITGASCGKSKDSSGVCKFSGDKLENPEDAIVEVDNSWGTGWGNNGRITMQFESSSGRRNNNIAGGDANAQVLETGYAMSPVVKTDYEWEVKGAKAVMNYEPESSFNPEELKQAIIKNLEAL